ncbi:hypothetical protein BGZ54_003370 [Gamsiella multidivaricata]|nr:hypothetical protein BGZ54_003370 [Gamsiella multidivaricata]
MSWYAPKSRHSYFASTTYTSWDLQAFCRVLFDGEGEVHTVKTVLLLWKSELVSIQNNKYTPSKVQQVIPALLESKPNNHVNVLFEVTNTLATDKLSVDHAESSSSMLRRVRQLQEEQEQENMQPTETAKRKKPRLLSWKDCCVEAWPNSDLSVFNLVSRRFMKQRQLDEASAKVLKDSVKCKRISIAAPGNMVDLIHNFKQQTTVAGLREVLKEYYELMALKSLEDTTSAQTSYIWNNLQNMSDEWVMSSFEVKQLEGFYTAFLHGPLVRIFRHVPKCTIKMTDPLTRCANLIGEALKPDITLVHKDFYLEFLIVESKPNGGRTGKKKDVAKIEKIMSGNMKMADDLLQQPHLKKQIRAWAIVLSGREVQLLEASFVEDTVIIYNIGHFNIPLTETHIKKFVSVLLAMIQLQERIHRYVEWIAEEVAVHPVSPANTSDSELFI